MAENNLLKRADNCPKCKVTSTRIVLCANCVHELFKAKRAKRAKKETYYGQCR